MASTLITPIKTENEFSGFIFIGYRHVVQHNAKDQFLCYQFANQMAIALENTYLVQNLQEMSWGSLNALANTVDAKSSWTAGHSKRVADIATSIGRAMRLPEKEIETIQRSGLVHDIGKIAIPRYILDKPGKLTGEEYRILCEHPRIGKKILQPIAAFKEIAMIVDQHHEHYDGHGYPDGASGEGICLGGRILAVADVFDACLSHRPYRSGMSFEKVIEIIKDGAGNQFDPQVVQTFLKIAVRDRDKMLANIYKRPLDDASAGRAIVNG